MLPGTWAYVSAGAVGRAIIVVPIPKPFCFVYNGESFLLMYEVAQKHTVVQSVGL